MANIKLNNNEYQITDSALAAPTADFIAHLQTIAGEGIRVVVGGVEYNVDPSKVAGAIADLEGALEDLNAGGDEPAVLAAGLYETGAVALYNERGAGAISNMLVTPWDQLVSDGIIIVDNGSVYTYADDENDSNASAEALSGDLIFPNDGSVVTLADQAFAYCNNITAVHMSDVITSIGSKAFCACINLAIINISNSAETIGASAFAACQSLTELSIPDSVITINPNAFGSCTSLETIKFGRGLSKINTLFSANCNVKYVYYNGTLAEWNAISKGRWTNGVATDAIIICSDGQVNVFG